MVDEAGEITGANPAPGTGKAGRIRDMFATIVPRYDLVNTLMTLGLDRRWRRATVAMAEPAGAVALDIATGTGELAFEIEHGGAGWSREITLGDPFDVAAAHDHGRAAERLIGDAVDHVGVAENNRLGWKRGREKQERENR